MEAFKKLTTELADRFNEISYSGDMSDIGNELGVIIAKYFDLGIGDVSDFNSGLKHGISLTDGTHDRK